MFWLGISLLVVAACIFIVIAWISYMLDLIADFEED